MGLGVTFGGIFELWLIVFTLSETFAEYGSFFRALHQTKNVLSAFSDSEAVTSVQREDNKMTLHLFAVLSSQI